MPLPIHSWEYISHGKTSKVELFHDHVLETLYYQPQTPIKRSFEHVFHSINPIGNLEVDFELIQYIISLTLPEEFSPETRAVYAFYKAFQLEKVIPESYEHEGKSSDFAHYYRSVKPYGLEQYYETIDGIWSQSVQRFDDFFFQGPVMSRLPLELRTRWKQMIWEALGDNPPFALEDGFVLFDYDKIEEKKYSTNLNNGTGDFLEVYKGYIMLGGWDGKDGGAVEYSIENIWYNRYLIPKELEEYFDEIFQNLESAIVGRKKKAVIENKVSIEKKGDTDAPGEAPPA